MYMDCLLGEKKVFEFEFMALLTEINDFFSFEIFLFLFI